MNNNNALIYKNYRAKIEYSAEDDCLVGSVLLKNDVISFHGYTVKDIKNDFHHAIDNYLNTCKKIGKDPDHDKTLPGSVIR